MLPVEQKAVWQATAEAQGLTLNDWIIAVCTTELTARSSAILAEDPTDP